MWKQYKTFFARFRFIGYVLMIAGIYLIVNGIKDYAEQSRQNDWLTTQATVTDVSSHVVRSHGSGNRSSTYYTLVYEYTVNGENYTGKSGQLSSPRLVGDVITVKYDPEAPEESTTTLSPHTRDLVVLLVLGTAIAAVGVYLSGVIGLVRELLQKGRTGKPNESVSKTDTGFDSSAIAKIPAKQWVPRLAAWLLAFAAVVLFVKFFLTSNIASPDEFRNAAVSAGYAAADSTEDLRESWGVGSMLSRSVSVYESSLRLDLCKMDSADSCRRLYAGMTLPITGEVTESNTLSHQVYAVDTPTNFSAKICIGQMLLYVFTTQEDKADVLAFLESVGYWDE
ncbi:hypothetical protein MM35RIKEN_21990 (plasmid) [Vescimonas fastidiosa]|uniref:DUF3592 domain-containing protein n=1 Tax=Vescimonas fastidiosa TaxID=2714353 RepID=A0A810Q154_9FIRM|nr:DUF3592 domain-containing protein [Vescimonas fastidiosa]BCK80007.1 hypothetical protein MM35RIKEN_21990 [Vescimonas fastidiosa]